MFFIYLHFIYQTLVCSEHKGMPCIYALCSQHVNDHMDVLLNNSLLIFLIFKNLLDACINFILDSRILIHCDHTISKLLLNPTAQSSSALLTLLIVQCYCVTVGVLRAFLFVPWSSVPWHVHVCNKLVYFKRFPSISQTCRFCSTYN